MLPLFFGQVQSQVGKWENAGSSGVVCILAVLMPNSHMLCVERPHPTPYPPNQLTGGFLSADINLKGQINADGSWTSTFVPIDVGNQDSPFCSHAEILANGSVLVVGGDFTYLTATQTLEGRAGRRIFEPCTTADCTYGKWVHLDNMNDKRWYPSPVMLSDERVIIIGGGQVNLDFSALDPATNSPNYEWHPKQSSVSKTLDLLSWCYPFCLYPQSYQLPSGNLFLMASNKSILIDPSTENVLHTIPDTPTTGQYPYIYPYTPVMDILPLTIKNNFKPVLQVCGGTLTNGNGSPNCLQINPDDASPVWKYVDPMPHPRVMPDSVILPADGKILYLNGAAWGVAGGNAGDIRNAGSPVYAVDLFDPEAETGKQWTTLAPAKQMRLYHSGAFLLETGHVITFGSEMDNYREPAETNCYPFVNVFNSSCSSPYNTVIERFTPPYLQTTQQRPKIVSAPSKLTPGSVFAIDLDTTTNISRVTFTRYFATTHSTHSGQRLVELVIVAKSSKTLYVKSPASTKLAPSGNYFLWVLNKNGIPSTGATVNFKLGAATNVTIPPDAVSILNGTITEPAKSDGNPMYAGMLVTVLCALLALVH
ncbi:glyoxal oxidase N-terminus-domain-containing protein [Gorgonomyces haynaldii]|nr:glyoxal oxidase N-terminus-domain-containing protein [Gorgonomyces haynaldii]